MILTFDWREHIIVIDHENFTIWIETISHLNKKVKYCSKFLFGLWLMLNVSAGRWKCNSYLLAKEFGLEKLKKKKDSDCSLWQRIQVNFDPARDSNSLTGRYKLHFQPSVLKFNINHKPSKNFEQFFIFSFSCAAGPNGENEKDRDKEWQRYAHSRHKVNMRCI